MLGGLTTLLFEISRIVHQPKLWESTDRKQNNSNNKTSDVSETQGVSLGIISTGCEIYVYSKPLFFNDIDSPLRFPPSRRLGGTYFPARGPPADACWVVFDAGSSFFFSASRDSCNGANESLYGHFVVQWSPLHIRQDTIFCPLSRDNGSSSDSWS